MRHQNGMDDGERVGFTFQSALRSEERSDGDEDRVFIAKRLVGLFCETVKERVRMAVRIPITQTTRHCRRRI